MNQTQQSHSFDPSPRNKRRLYRIALARLSRIALLALLCVGIVVSAANDLYAFVKPDRAVVLTLGEPQPILRLSRHLASLGVIRNPSIFALYAKRSGRQAMLESFSGELALNASMSYRELLLAFANAA